MPDKFNSGRDVLSDCFVALSFVPVALDFSEEHFAQIENELIYLCFEVVVIVLIKP